MSLGSSSARSLVIAWMIAVATVSAAEKGKPELGEPFLLEQDAPAVPARAVIGQPSMIALSPFQPAGVSTRIRRTLLQYEALVADEAWDEAVELIETLQTEAGEQLTKLPTPASAPVDSPEKHLLYAPLRERCQRLLAELPAAGIEAYRDRVGRTARQRLDAAVEELDEAAAASIAHELRQSAAASDALLAAAELAFERGDTAAARRYLQRLHPMTLDPLGRPAAASVAQLRADIEPEQLAGAWREAHATDPSKTTDEELLSAAIARLALVSLQEGDTRRAVAERRLLEALAPGAVGRIAGRQQVLGAALDALIAETHLTGAPHAPPVGLGPLAWAWEAATPVSPGARQPEAINRRPVAVNGLIWQQRLALLRGDQANQVDPTPTTRPVSVGMSAFYVESNKVKRLRLTDGQITDLKLPGIPEESAATSKVAASPIVLNGRQIIRIGPNGQVQQLPTPVQPARQIDPALAVSGGLVFARVVEANRQTRRRGPVAPSAETLIGFDPHDPMVAAVRLLAPRDPENPAPAWQFSGPPVVRGERLYVGMASGSGRKAVGVACYSTATGRRRWFTELGSGVPATGLGRGGATTSLTLEGDRLYVATELGAVAAIESASGRVGWIAVYPRNAEVRGFQRGVPPAPARPCVVAGDQVLAAPSGSNRLFAWDAASGRPLWAAARPDGASIAGAVRSASGTVVVLAGRQVTAYDTLTGRRLLAWPESAHAGLRGIGTAAVVGGEVFWPTRDAIYAIDPVRGGFTRSPIDLTPVSEAGANVLRTDAGLLVCGPKRLRLLADPENPEPSADLSRLMDGGPRNAILAQQEIGTADERR